MSQDGVLNLAGEFVHNFYHTVVGEQFTEAVDLYKESATLSRGTEGARAESVKDALTEVTALHQKVKGATAEILSIDASLLKSQEIVITVVVAFRAVQTIIVQTLILEAEVSDEDTPAAWYISADNTRFLSFPQFGTGAGTARPARSTPARAGKQTGAKATSASPAESSTAAAATTSNTSSTAPSAAAESKPSVVPVTATAAPTEKPAAAENNAANSTAAAVVASADPKNEVKLTNVKGNTRGKKTATTGAATEASKKDDKPPTASTSSEPAKPAAPKSWAFIAASPKADDHHTSPAASTASSTTTTATATAAPAKTSTAKAASSTSAAPAKTESSSSSSSSGEITIFFRARSAIEKDAASAKLSEFAPIKDLELTTDKLKVVVTFTTSEDPNVFQQRITDALPSLKIGSAEVTGAESSRKNPESLRRSNSSTGRPAKSTSASDSASPSTSSSRGSRTGGPRTGGPRTGGSPATTKKE